MAKVLENHVNLGRDWRSFTVQGMAEELIEYSGEWNAHLFAKDLSTSKIGRYASVERRRFFKQVAAHIESNYNINK